MRNAVILICLATFSVAGSVLAAEGEDTHILVKPGGSFEERARDQERCRAAVRSAPAQDLPSGGTLGAPAFAAPDVATAVGASIAFAIIGAFDTRRARDRAEVFCLQNLGYFPVPLTAEEIAVYGPLTNARREEWERELLATDLSERLAPLTTPLVPSLPPYGAPAPGAQGGIQVSVESLAVAAGAVGVDGVAVTGEISRVRTAVLAEPFATTEGFVRIAGEAGAVFHQVDYRPQQSPLLRVQGATWCGPVRQVSETGRGAPDVYCFTTQIDGYDVHRPTGYAWLVGPYRGGLVLPRFREPIVLQERERDDVGPFVLQIKVVKTTASRLDLSAYALREQQRVLLWERRLSFDAEGDAVLPLWTRRAVFTKAAVNEVTVRLDDLGDGRGWREND